MVERRFTWAMPVTESGTPCIVYTVGEATFRVIMFKGSLCTFCMHGMTKAQPPTTIKGCLWKHPETTMASLGPPVTNPIRHILPSLMFFYCFLKTSTQQVQQVLAFILPSNGSILLTEISSQSFAQKFRWHVTESWRNVQLILANVNSTTDNLYRGSNCDSLTYATLNTVNRNQHQK